MAAIYVRLRDDVHAWVKQQSEVSGLSLAITTETLLAEAMRRGWKVRPNIHGVEVPRETREDT